MNIRFIWYQGGAHSSSLSVNNLVGISGIKYVKKHELLVHYISLQLLRDFVEIRIGYKAIYDHESKKITQSKSLTDLCTPLDYRR